MNEITIPITILFGLASAIVAWFLRDIYGKFEQSRHNDRELYQKMADTREDVLRQHIEILKDQINFLRSQLKLRD